MIKNGCTLIGIYFFVTGLAVLPAFPKTLSAYDQDLHQFVLPENWPILAASNFAAVAFLWLLPSALLVRLAPSIAARFEDDEPKAEVSETGLYVILALALAVYFLIYGVSNLTAGLVLLVPELLEEPQYGSLHFGLSPVLMSVVQMLSAFAIYRHSLRVARSPS